MLALGLQSELGHVSFIHYEKNVRPYSPLCHRQEGYGYFRKKGHNSETLWPTGMSCTSTRHSKHVYQVSFR